MMRRAYRASNPNAPLAVFLTVGLFVAAMGYGVMKLRDQEE